MNLDCGLFNPSSVCIEHVIIAFPSWAAMVYYYQAFNVINQEGGSYNSKLKAKTFLKKALSLLETEREAVLSRNQILKAISDVSRSGGTSLHPDCFKKQNDGEVECLSVHINAIYSAIGSVDITDDHLLTSGVIGDQAAKVFKCLSEEAVEVIRWTLSSPIASARNAPSCVDYSSPMNSSNARKYSAESNRYTVRLR